MKLFYPLQAQHDYTELRYSLRSVEKYVPNSEIIIAGDTLPDWVTGITQIHVKDIPCKKQLTIRKKILAALEYSKEIFFLNDDYFFLRPVQPENFPYYFHGNVRESGESGARPLKEQLEAKGKDIKHFDIHVPIIYERDKFRALEVFSSECIVKSMYANFHEVPGVAMPDTKINSQQSTIGVKERIKDKIVFSTGPAGLKFVLPVLQDLFPKKSRYELW